MPIARRLTLALVTLLAAAVLASSTTATASASSTAQEREVIRLVNELRTERGIAPLRFAASLFRAARNHSADMGRRGYFSHTTRSTGAHFVERIQQQKPGAVRWLGENIAWGVADLGTPRGIVKAWWHSAPHRRTMLDPRFRRIGLGAWHGTYRGHARATIYTANFAG